MSGTAKKWIAIVGGALFVAAACALKWSAMPAHLHPSLHEDCELALMVLGMLGITAPISIMTPASQQQQPLPLELPKDKS